MRRVDDVLLQFDVFHLTSDVDLLYRGGEVVSLEPRAVCVLRYLVEHHDRVLSKEELLEAVWLDVFTTDGVLKKAVSQIRRALGDDPEKSRYIATYHGRGYRFVAPVTRAPTARQPDSSSGRVRSELVPSYDQLAGRDSELLTLRAELRSALELRPRPVVIVGDPGIGKTHLVRHFSRTAQAQGAIALYARFFDYRAARLAPYEVFVDLLSSALGGERGTSLRDAIEATCGVQLPVELFSDSFRSAAAAPGNVGDHFRLVVPICRSLLRLSRRQPLVIVFDDLQWADSASLDVIGCLMRLLESEPLMPIMVIRSSEAGDPEHPVAAWLGDHALRRGYTTLRLEPLAEADCRDIIGAIFGTRRSGDVPRSDVERLFRLTNGNPYFLVETLRLLVSKGAIEQAPGKDRWVWRGLQNLSLPETIVTASRTKIDRLPRHVRAVIDQAAVIGDEFRVATLCRLTGLGEAEMEEILSEAMVSGILSIQGLTPGEDCRFEHSILRRVVYDAIVPYRRRELHKKAAEAIGAVYSEERDRVAESLASHYAAAGDTRQAFESGMRAWRTASRRSEWRKAAALIERVEKAASILEREQPPLSQNDRIELLLALGETWSAIGRIREASSVIDRAVTLSAAAGYGTTLAHALLLRGLTEIALSRYGEASASLSHALDLYVQNDCPADASRAIVQLAAVAAAVGNYERASLLVEQLRVGNPADDILARANGILGWSLALRGKYQEGAAQLTEALEYHESVDDIRERSMILRRLHWVHLSLGDYETAIQLAVRARTDSITIGDTNGEAKANMGIGQARVAQGLYDEAISFLTRAIEQLKAIGDAHCEAECLWQLGRARTETGAIDEADLLLERALTMVREIGDRDDEFRILIDRARLEIARTDLDAATESALAAARIATTLNNEEGTALADVELARVELARGNAQPAAEIAHRAVAVLEQSQSSERLHGWLVRGHISRSAGDSRQATLLHGKAVEFLERVREQLDPDDTARRRKIARNAERLTKQLVP
jgi:DNA-binding winged helix-turn-helix (wHTH) protein/tetratricopeptide (TPR) repeat protein